MVPGLTFVHREGRVDGLLHGKKVYLVFGVAEQGHGPASPGDDFHEEYLRLMLKIMGLTDVEVIRIDDARVGAAWDKVDAILEEGFR
jgi:FMN-dependent NADH-azoreductase